MLKHKSTPTPKPTSAPKPTPIPAPPSALKPTPSTYLKTPPKQNQVKTESKVGNVKAGNRASIEITAQGPNVRTKARNIALQNNAKFIQKAIASKAVARTQSASKSGASPSARWRGQFNNARDTYVGPYGFYNSQMFQDSHDTYYIYEGEAKLPIGRQKPAIVLPETKTKRPERIPLPLSSAPYALGSDTFREAAEDNGRIIDKTLFIEKVLSNRSPVKLIIRPKRFGKTFNLSMLACFFDKNIKEDARKLFINREIWSKDKGAFQKHQGEYTVVFITFKGIKADTFEKAIQQIRELMGRTCATCLRENQIKPDLKVEKILKDYADEVSLQLSLFNLIELLNEKSGKNIILLIDEYDTPLYEAYHNTPPDELSKPKSYYRSMINFIRNMFSPILKGNASIYRTVLTGILRVSKENIFSEMGSVKLYSIIDDNFSEYFGFSKDEVEDELTAAFGSLADEVLFDQVGRWYGGYHIGNQVLFSPYEITNFIHDNSGYTGKTAPIFKNYWIKTSSNKAVKDLLSQYKELIKDDFKALMNNQAVSKIIDEQITFTEINEDPGKLWSYLLLTGYLTTYHGAATSCVTPLSPYQLVIPNQELYDFYLSNIAKMELADSNLLFQQHNSELSKVVSYTPEKQVDHFVERIDLLKQLSTAFENAKKSQEENKAKVSMIQQPVVVLCVGLGGVGKTQLALYYANNPTKFYSKVLWFNASSRNALINRYRLFAKQHQLIDNKFFPDDEIIKEVHDWFARHSNWLIVYDNVKDYDDIFPFLPKQGVGNILITSRIVLTDWPMETTLIYVDVLSDDDAAKLITSLLLDPDPAIPELTQKLGCLPLALVQACGYILHHNISITEYLNQYEKDAVYLLSQSYMPPGFPKQDAVFVTWDNNFSTIDKEEREAKKGECAKELMNFCAYLDPANNPIFLLQAWYEYTFAGSKYKIDDMLIVLRKHSLIQAGNKDGLIRIHPLIQQVIQGQLTPEMRKIKLEESTHLLVEICESKLKEDAVFLQLKPHLQAVIKYYERMQIKGSKYLMSATGLLSKITSGPSSVSGQKSKASSPLTSKGSSSMFGGTKAQVEQADLELPLLQISC